MDKNVYEIEILKWEKFNAKIKEPSPWFKFYCHLVDHEKWRKIKAVDRSMYIFLYSRCAQGGTQSYFGDTRTLALGAICKPTSVFGAIQRLSDVGLIRIVNAPKTLPERKKERIRRKKERKNNAGGVEQIALGMPESAPASQGTQVQILELKTPVQKTWNAYSEEYPKHYPGATATKNAKVLGQLGHFVKRVPQEEAPEIARFYLSHKAPKYVASAHSISYLLLDAEKLRTEWLRGRKITQQEIKNSEFKDSLQSQLERI